MSQYLDHTIRQLLDSPQADGNYHVKETVDRYIAAQEAAAEKKRENAEFAKLQRMEDGL